MHEPPFAFVSHKTATRIRLKVPSKKKTPAFFASLAEKLPAVNGIRSVETNALTGSVLLSHSSDPDHIVQALGTAGYFRFGNAAAERAGLQTRISETFEGVDFVLRDVTGNELDIGGTTFLILLAVSGFQIIRGNFIAIPWYAAGWYAFNIFLKSNTGRQPVP